MTEPNSFPESDEPQVTNLSHVDVEMVHAELVRMHQSSAKRIEAEEVELHLSGVIDAKTDRVTAHESVLGLVNATEFSMQNSAAGAVRAENASINGYTGAVIAGNVEMGNAYAGVVVGRAIRGEQIESILLLSPRVEGNVTTVMDTRGAVIAGLLGGLFAGLMFLLGQALFGRKS